MKVAEVIESVFTQKEVEVIKATIRHGLWGDTSETMANGEAKYGYGYLTKDAKRGLPQYTPRQIAGIFSGIAKKIKENGFDFMCHIPDYWGEGKTSDGMLIVSDEAYREIEIWARCRT